MSEKGYVVLQALVRNFGARFIRCVLAARDQSVSKDWFEEIESSCAEHQITCIERTHETEYPEGYCIAISWRWMIQPDNLRKVIVIHDSLLPRYRGFNPLVSALVNGDTEIGATALFADSGTYDTGGIIASRACSIRYPLKIQEAIGLISAKYVELALEIGDAIQSGRPIPSTPQDESLATYSLWRDEQDYRIDWNLESHVIQRFIDAVGPPYQGARATANGINVRILNAQAMDDVNIINRTPGKVIFFATDKPVVVCGKGLLRIIDIADERGEPYRISKFRTRFS